MILYLFTFLIIFILILTNAITDAPNAISTLVGTKVMKFKKAAYLSAVFNFLGTIVMSMINISVANCISSMINLEDGTRGIIALCSGMMAVIIFALVAMNFGIPTSETHGLVAGLTGASIALYNFNAINWNEWKNVIIGLVWSIIGTYIISIFLSKILKNIIDRLSKQNIQKTQILGCCAMSFMHGAQDGQKFVGVIILLLTIINKAQPTNYNIIIFLVAIIMGIGVSIGGRKIVENIGENIVKIDNKQALITDISTAITLLFASLTGLPVSTTHVKTMSIISVGKFYQAKIDHKKILDIFKAWVFTFPVCGIFAYIFTLIATSLAS